MKGAHRPIKRLVKTAAEQNTLDGISQMLRVVTEEMNAWGTLIWLAVPGSDIPAGKGRLFVLAYWVQDPKIRVWHELPFESMIGRVLQSGEAATIRIGDPRIVKPEPRLLPESESKHFCLAPFEMQDGSRGVLEVYRVEDNPFSEE